MAYATVDVIVNGALDESATIHDYALLNEYLEGVEQESISHGYPTEVYVMHHDHELSDEDCECAQYVTDHTPDYEYNKPRPMFEAIGIVIVDVNEV